MAKCNQLTPLPFKGLNEINTVADVVDLSRSLQGANEWRTKDLFMYSKIGTFYTL